MILFNIDMHSNLLNILSVLKTSKYTNLPSFCGFCFYLLWLCITQEQKILQVRVLN